LVIHSAVDTCKDDRGRKRVGKIDPFSIPNCNVSKFVWLPSTPDAFVSESACAAGITEHSAERYWAPPLAVLSMVEKILKS
jgi:hypothetical protein